MSKINYNVTYGYKQEGLEQSMGEKMKKDNLNKPRENNMQIKPGMA